MPGPKSFKRTDRVSAQLRREVGAMVHEAVREHGLPSASVSDVEVSRDMAHAKVYVTALQSERSAEVVAALKELAREFRHRLGRMLRMRTIPELHFHYDPSVDRGEAMDRLLREAGVGPVETDEADEADDEAPGSTEGPEPGR